MHTNYKKLFPATLDAMTSVMDPKKLRWIGFSHFEPDECGALNEWLKVAPQAQAMTSVVGAMVMMDDFADRPARALADDERVPTGNHRLQFLATPHVPHGWDAGMFFDEVSRTLFCSDLFFHPGDPSAADARATSSVRPRRQSSRAGKGRWRTTFRTRRKPTAYSSSRRASATHARGDARLLFPWRLPRCAREFGRRAAAPGGRRLISG